MKRTREDQARYTLADEIFQLLTTGSGEPKSTRRWINIIFNMIIVREGLRPGFLTMRSLVMELRHVLTMYRLYALQILYDGLYSQVISLEEDRTLLDPHILFSREERIVPIRDPVTRSIHEWMGKQLGYYCPRSVLNPAPLMVYEMSVVYHGMEVQLFAFGCNGDHLLSRRTNFHQWGIDIQRVLTMKWNIICTISTVVGIPTYKVRNPEEGILIINDKITGPDSYLLYLLLGEDRRYDNRVLAPSA